jgi:ubiquinone/menaquinone biosynthesis C-methylase UbiE
MGETHKAYFNALAPRWNGMMPKVSMLMEWLVQFGASAGECILDVGTGTGRTAAALADLVGPGGRVLALDLAERMLAEAKRAAPGSAVRFLCADAASLPLKDRAVDRILVFSTFPHFLDPERAVREMHRVLKTGGNLLVLHACSSEVLNRFHASLDGPVSRDVLPRADALAKLLSDCGFEEKRVLENEELYWVEALKA